MTQEELPEGEYAIVELMGHQVLVGRIAEVERFGVKMMAIEPLFNNTLLPAVYNGGASIYRITPCNAAVAWDQQPRGSWGLPASIRAVVPAALLEAESSVETRVRDVEPPDPFDPMPF